MTAATGNSNLLIVLKIFLLMIITLVFLTKTAQAFAATYYVATSGSDSNNGSQSAPFKTINKGVSVAGAGDTVYVRGGTYKESVDVSRGGNSGGRLVISSYQNESAIIDVGGVSGNGVNVKDGADYVTINGFKVQNGGARGIQINSNNGVVSNNTIYNFQDSGINTRDKSGVQILNNSVSRTAQLRHPGGGWPAAISVWGNSTNTLIRGNTSFNNDGEGINCWGGTTGCQIKENTVYGNTSKGIYIDRSTNALVENNLLYNGSSGIGIADEQTPVRSANITIRNNMVIASGKHGLTFFSYQSGSGLKNVIYENNTVVNSSGNNINVTNGSHSGTQFKNNVIYSSNGKDLMVFGTPGNTVFSNNVFYDTRGTGSASFSWNGSSSAFGSWVQSSSNKFANPGFVNPTGTNPANYKISSSSSLYGLNIGSNGSVGSGTVPIPSNPPPTVLPTKTPVPSSQRCQPYGDMSDYPNCKGFVNALDLSYFLSKWDTTDFKANLDNAGKVNSLDLSIILGNLGN